MKLQLGRILATPGVLRVLEESKQPAAEFLSRHARGDWGDLGTADKQLNDEAILNGDRILSAYKTTSGTKIWIITEADRSATTVLLPAEY